MKEYLPSIIRYVKNVNCVLFLKKCLLICILTESVSIFSLLLYYSSVVHIPQSCCDGISQQFVLL